MACCVLVAMIVARLRQLLGLGGPTRKGGPSLVLMLGLAAVELGIAWAIARGLTEDAGMSMHPMADETSHLVLMLQLMLLGVGVPVLLARLFPARDRSYRPRARRQLFAATLAAPTVLWFWHLPAAHDHTGSAWQLVRGGTVLVTGVAFWRCVLGAGRRVAPPAARQIAVIVAGQANALLGLALLFTTDPLHGGGDGLWGLSAVADQRAAGALMLVVEIGVMVPVLASLNAQRQAARPQVTLRMPQPHH